MLEKILKFLIVISFSAIAFFLIYSLIVEKRAEKEVINYINETSKVIDEKITENENNETTNDNIELENKEDIKTKLTYNAILEIPIIKLKQGLINCDEDFKMINYAIGIDSNSTYPDQNGNFILYAHSGNSKIAYFDDLYKIDLDDDIYVYYNGIKYNYKVINKYNIEKTGTASILTSKTNKYITLITCNQQESGKQIVVVGEFVNQLSY